MAKLGYIQRYLSIIRKVKNHNHITLKELIREVENEIALYDETDSLGISKRTIQRDFADIEKLFNIRITYSKTHKGYFISDEESNRLEKQLEHIDLLGTLDSKLENIVYPDNRKSKGTEYLFPLISAIKKSLMVEFRYRKFDNTVTKEKRIVQPYALKEFKSRWYLLAVEVDGRLEERGQIKTWGLDRIENFQLTNRFFTKNASIDIQAEFWNCFGIHSDEDKEMEEVILSFSPISGKYNDTLPLHHSQETLIDDEKEFRIKLKVKITEDFIMELLSQSENLNVIAPLHLKKRLIIIHRNAVKLLEA